MRKILATLSLSYTWATIFFTIRKIHNQVGSSLVFLLHQATSTIRFSTTTFLMISLLEHYSFSTVTLQLWSFSSLLTAPAHVIFIQLPLKKKNCLSTVLTALYWLAVNPYRDTGANFGTLDTTTTCIVGYHFHHCKKKPHISQIPWLYFKDPGHHFENHWYKAGVFKLICKGPR